ncbi:hypothetical protein [Pseudarthrobacter sp. BIM B-2242]|uniref:hypothetical protein n=1 Tax=Pseudarthrobacter sp. BIM B-2242 TaxID=2772401 RepID=UPI00168A476A|nr:hypothetical protein [Pseudarthrobacter sp. BIM B-2242]QOD05854.1 hypothetical protein IDT60_22960 [Pseudarthrobacter sp. BIM B-2242]
MTTPDMALPTRIADRTAAAVKNLSTDQLHDILIASTQRSGRVLPVLWETVRAADPVLVQTLDDLHEKEAPVDMPRFEALRELHERNLNAAVKTRAGRMAALQAVAGIVMAPASAIAAIAGALSFNIAVSGVVIGAYLLFRAFQAARKLTDEIPTRMFGDAGLAASLVWDTAVDAAASAALRHREGEEGLTSDLLDALSSTWTGAGLPLDLLVPEVDKAIDAEAKAPQLAAA